VPHQLVDPLQEMQIRFGFHIEGRGAKGRRMARSRFPMRSPACRRDARKDAAQRVSENCRHINQGCLALAFGKIFIPVAGDRDRRES
jgi:hypothetical protein